MKEALQKRFGEHRVSDVSVQEGEIPLLMLDLELKSPVTVIMTNGLHSLEMPVPELFKDRPFTELYFCLPSYWEWEDTANPNMNWPFVWIQKLAQHLQEKETWYAPGHTFPCGEEGLSATMTQSYLFLSDPLLLEEELAPIEVEGKNIHFLGIIPLFKKEFEFKQSRGTYQLIKKLNDHHVSEKLDNFRGSVLKRRWRLSRH